MKAVLIRSVDPGRIVDLSHDLRPHAVVEAAFLVRAMAERFPPGTIHVVVVDPGVGGRRAGLAIECADGSLLVGPDNGVLWPLAEALGFRRAVRLAPVSGLGAARAGTTFDGRDLFAPAAAALAAGRRITALGPPQSPEVLRLPTPTLRPDTATGEIVHIDRFGNLITNLPSDTVPAEVHRMLVRVGRGRNRRLPRATSYEALGPGRLGVIGSSFGLLELSVSHGRAEERLGARVGTPVRIDWRRRHTAGER